MLLTHNQILPKYPPCALGALDLHSLQSGRIQGLQREKAQWNVQLGREEKQ